MTHFGDPTFGYHVTAARLWGVIAMRLAEAEGLPLDYRDYASQVSDFFAESLKTARSRSLAAAFDEKAMTEAVQKFSEEAARIEKSRQEIVADNRNGRNEAKLRRINDALIGVERALTDPRGLRGRVWYTHQIYAPGTYTGYAAQPLPDFRQALEDRNSLNAREAMERIVEALNRATEVLKKARD